jgi:protein TonB
MKTRVSTSIGIGAFTVGMLVFGGGCAQTPLHQSTLESSVASATVGDAALTPPRPLRTVEPFFPTEMQRAGISGSVRLTCMVDETGRVRDPLVAYASHRAFVEPALDAVKNWRFKPAEREGVPVAAQISLPIAFTIRD